MAAVALPLDAKSGQRRTTNLEAVGMCGRESENVTDGHAHDAGMGNDQRVATCMRRENGLQRRHDAIMEQVERFRPIRSIGNWIAFEIENTFRIDRLQLLRRLAFPYPKTDLGKTRIDAQRQAGLGSEFLGEGTAATQRRTDQGRPVPLTGRGGTHLRPTLGRKRIVGLAAITTPAHGFTVAQHVDQGIGSARQTDYTARMNWTSRRKASSSMLAMPPRLPRADRLAPSAAHCR